MFLYSLVIINISKRNNVHKLIDAALAFGCQQILIVGQTRNFDVERYNDQQHIIARFQKWKDCQGYLYEHGMQLVGVEIHEKSVTVEEYIGQVCDGVSERPNSAPHHVALVMGNEGTGLSDKLMEACEYFIRIPQYGRGTASLNVYVAASVVLSQFYYSVSSCDDSVIEEKEEIKCIGVS